MNRARGGGYGAPRRNIRNHLQRVRQLSPLIMMLLVEIFAQVERLPFKPKVTIALLATNIGAHLFGDVDLQQHCLCADRIIRHFARHQSLPLGRFIYSGFLHADDKHLYYNMTSLCWKGIQLEQSIGSKAFFTLCAFSLVVSHFVAVVMACALRQAVGYDEPYYACAVGFSAVLFSLKYVLNCRSPELTNIHGIQVPLKHACWLELVLISLITPNASFVGHLAGIVTGVLWQHSGEFWEMIHNSNSRPGGGRR